MQGRRLPDLTLEAYQGWPRDLQPGDYFKVVGANKTSFWGLKAPNGDEGAVRENIHTITVYEDQTITVSPSIQFETGKRWHGYLERGVWRSC